MKRCPLPLLGLWLLANGALAQAIVAHRGASFDAPENTLAAFRLAWKQGADAIEGDFLLTKDEKVVCHHDSDLQRTANDPREVAEMTLAELRQLDVGSWKHPRFAGERIPTLTEVLALVGPGKRLFLEIKCGPEIIGPLGRTLAQTALSADQIVIISFDKEVIRLCRKHLPAHRANWLTDYKENLRGRWEPSSAEVMQTLQQIDASGLGTEADPDRVTTALVAKIRDAGLQFHCWTVNGAALARHFQALGVDSITTDRPAWLRARLQAPATLNPASNR